MNITEIKVSLEGLSDIMFDRFIDHSKEDRPPEKKLYLNGDNELVLPMECLHSFLFRDMAPVGIIRTTEKNKAKDYIAFGQAYVAIEPVLIPFRDAKGRTLVFNGFGNGSPLYINDWSAGVTKMSNGKVIKQEVRKRPVLKLPWFLDFRIQLVENDKITEEKLRTWFELGGMITAIGTYRPRYGRFTVKKWEKKGK